jgi:hypothetical protein
VTDNKTSTPVGQHDPYCPKLFPSRVLIDAETGDGWTLGPTKFLCACDQLAAARATGRRGLELRMAHIHNELSEDPEHTLGDPVRLSELRDILDLSHQVMETVAMWEWLGASNVDLDGAAPLDLIADGQYQRVADLLTALAEGVTS